MDKVKILVVEDEMIIADNICDALEELGYQALEPAISYTEAIGRIEEEKPDIAILDIQLSGKKTGIDIAKKIRESYHFPFIFLTSNADSLTLNQAKEVMPPAYLIKPFSKEELYTSIEIALSNYSIIHKNKEDEADDSHVIKDAFFIKNKGSFLKIYFDDILYLKSDHVYVELHLKNTQQFLVRRSLNDILSSLDARFVRIQRSFVVNVKYISEVKTASVIINNSEIPIGKTYKEELIKFIKLI
ncbi:two component transcriptional regulator, LytTR family [Polaribacter sp. KT25b]|uniref:LytR/AlgR family response regulator transcription factor n=1 Tax=Polaribacter sp. KT25b TaxID=1855336 RepID=UPI00087DBBB6|nr:response regulator [Polaribacter sp. KT25b]SDS44791.1 two component transcriptional regulator, LytTR family [Polaribacter sp. KT25b]